MRLQYYSRVLPLPTALATLTFAPESAHAQERSTPALSLHGFGTIGAVYSSEDRADFVWNPLQPSGPGHSKTVSPDVDSRLGLQLSAYLTPKLSAIVQVVAEQTYRDDYRPGLEWAYLDYAMTPDLSFRAGRRPVASFMVSEYRKVSYANPWIRPPVEVYGLSPIAHGEAVEASYRIHRGDWTSTVQLGLALTAQVDFIDVFENSPGTFINRQPGWEPGGSAQLFSVAAAFVF